LIAVPRTLRLLVHHDTDADCWVARCVDFDMVTQAKRFEDLPTAFGHVFYGTVLVALEHNERPRFVDPPQYIVNEWERVSRNPEGIKVRNWDDYVPHWVPEAFMRLIESKRQPPDCVSPRQLNIACA